MNDRERREVIELVVTGLGEGAISIFSSSGNGEFFISIVVVVSLTSSVSTKTSTSSSSSSSSFLLLKGEVENAEAGGIGPSFTLMLSYSDSDECDK